MRPDAGAWFRQRTTAAPSLADIDPAALLRPGVRVRFVAVQP